MKYYTWVLDWANGEGTDPTATLNSDNVRIEPQFAVGDLSDSGVLVYAVLFDGEIDTTMLSKWSVQETTVDAMLDAARLVDSNAILVDGLVQFPMPEMEKK